MSAARRSRKTLGLWGQRGDQVRALVDAARDRVIVHYRDADGAPRKKLFPNDGQGRRDARAWGASYHAERARMQAQLALPAAMTLEEVWREYVHSPAYLKDLRPASQIAYRQRWAKWQHFLGRDFRANDTTLADVDRFRTSADAAGMATNQIRQVLNVVRTVYKWAKSRKHVQVNEVAEFRWTQPKDAVVNEPGEYAPGELEAMLRTLDPTRHDQWRPWVALLLVAESGQRANAIRHLTLADFDFAADEIVWNAAYQKQGKELRRPITWGLYSAWLVATAWRARELAPRVPDGAGARVRGDDGRFHRDPDAPAPVAVETPWLLYALTDKAKPYSYSSLHYQWRQAEQRAGVRHERYRAVHGGRRTVVGDYIEATGDRMLGLEYVGDTDPKQLKNYDKRQKARLERAVATVERRPTHATRPVQTTKGTPESVPETSLSNQPTTTAGATDDAT